MIKKIFSLISVLILSISGSSAKSELSSVEIAAKQQAEINERLKAEQEGLYVITGQCDDACSMTPIDIEKEKDRK